MIIDHHPSPNCGVRKSVSRPDMVVLHYTAMETATAAIERLCDPVAEVSAHYVLAEDGKLTQLVDDDQRAWHAGAGAWGDVRDVNSHSIGIEIANTGPDSSSPEFPAAQMNVLYEVLGDILHRHAIPNTRVIGHSDMAPGRKFDPGPYFNWKDLADKGLSIWPEPSHLTVPDWERFTSAALIFGYRPPDDSLNAWVHVLGAFRLRFNVDQTGELTGTDVAIIETLARDYPCQRTAS